MNKGPVLNIHARGVGPNVIEACRYRTTDLTSVSTGLLSLRKENWHAGIINPGEHNANIVVLVQYRLNVDISMLVPDSNMVPLLLRSGYRICGTLACQDQRSDLEKYRQQRKRSFGERRGIRLGRALMSSVSSSCDASERQSRPFKLKSITVHSLC